jgi:hypothetical protein
MPSDRKTVIPFYSLRIRHLVTIKANVIVECAACRRKSTLDPLLVLAARGPEFGVKHLEQVLRCEGCGHRGFARVSVEWL